MGRVLRETYGHVPLYAARFAGGQLEGLLPLMEVSSPFTGRRGVSLPFTDFCLSVKDGGAWRRGFVPNGNGPGPPARLALSGMPEQR